MDQPSFSDRLMTAKHTHRTWRDALVNVTDMATMCRTWLDENAPGYTPTDLVEMTKLVVTHQNADLDRQLAHDLKD